MYEIILKTWYQETPEKTYDEVYGGWGFETIDDACKFLGENYVKILDLLPVDSITIKFNNSRR